jgi:hypothetical protein
MDEIPRLNLWNHDQGTHHVVLFVFQNMAVPHIVVSTSSWANRHPSRNFEIHDHLRHFSRVHSDGFLPPYLVSGGRLRGPVEARRSVVVLRIKPLPLQGSWEPGSEVGDCFDAFRGRGRCGVRV